MKKEDFKKYLDDTFNQIRQIESTKGETYTLGTGDKFRNFRTIAEDLDIDQKMVLWVYLRKHLDALLHEIKSPGNSDDPEGTQSRIQDCMLYLALLGGMYYEEEGRKRDYDIIDANDRQISIDLTNEYNAYEEKNKQNPGDPDKWEVDE